MSMETLTIKFRGQGPQSAWRARLEDLCSALVAEGVVKAASVQTLFPDHREPTLARMFTVDVLDASVNVSDRFARLCDVEYAAWAASRRALSHG